MSSTRARLAGAVGTAIHEQLYCSRKQPAQYYCPTLSTSMHKAESSLSGSHLFLSSYNHVESKGRTTAYSMHHSHVLYIAGTNRRGMCKNGHSTYILGMGNGGILFKKICELVICVYTAQSPTIIFTATSEKTS